MLFVQKVVMNQTSPPRRSWLALLLGTFILTGSWVILHQWLLVPGPAQTMSVTETPFGPTATPSWMVELQFTETPNAQTVTAADFLATRFAPFTQEAQNGTATADAFNATKWAPATKAVQTEMASYLTPTPCIYCTFPILSEDVAEPQSTPEGVNAGAGVITSITYGAAGFVAANAWYETVGSGYIIVFAGSSHRDTSSGIEYQATIVVRGWQPGVFSGGTYVVPVKANSVKIGDAQGERLILETSEGQILYFDVPGQSFVTSLTEVVPTVTAMPTLTPFPSATSSFADDAPDYSGHVSELSLLNVSLTYFINFKEDVDWFAFHNEATQTLEVKLLSLPANYDVFVYSADNADLSGASTNIGFLEERTDSLTDFMK